MDRVGKEIRHKIMSANPGKNTLPEMEVRSALFKEGFRYKIHVASIPGKPDLVLPRFKCIVFVHGCFWHGHDCKRKPESKSNRIFWKEKISHNRKRDLIVRNKLLASGWRLLVVWECAIRRQRPVFIESPYLKKIAKWIRGNGKLAILSESGFEECL